MASFAKFGNDLYSGRRSYDIVGKRRVWFITGLVIMVLCGLLLGIRGLNPGIDFRGGSEFTISNTQTLDQSLAQTALDEVVRDQGARVSSVGGSTVRVQTESLTDEQTSQLSELLAEAYGTTPDDVTSSFVGPTWGQDVTGKAIQGLVIFLVLVSVVMTLYFRRWTMAAGALVALLHDMVITAGVYALVGFEITPATVIGFLTIIGYSLYDTVVVFDKVRENTDSVTEQTRFTYAEGANLAVNQTLVRSINTSVVAVLPVASILFVGAFLLGAGTLRDIALVLFIGMLIGTFSSIFIATPVQVALYHRNPVIKEHTEKVLALRERRLSEAEAEGLPAASVATGAAGLRAGSHQGQQAQPRRRPKSKR